MLPWTPELCGGFVKTSSEHVAVNNLRKPMPIHALSRGGERGVFASYVCPLTQKCSIERAAFTMTEDISIMEWA